MGFLKGLRHDLLFDFGFGIRNQREKGYYDNLLFLLLFRTRTCQLDDNFISNLGGKREGAGRPRVPYIYTLD